MREGQEVIFIYNRTIMKGILWEKGLLDYGIKCPQYAGIVYVRHEQVVTGGIMSDALAYLNS